jgi:alkanesulfonate monooxygenase SsuD/methylene tetrahydromethanopterin reductase-like flavin-dependent oxidoreductase (luciferase family)
MRYSLLDLAPVPEGSEIPQSFQNSTDLARQAEAWGYHRYWLAEHHNMPGIASAATAVLIGHIASQTKSIRVGAGGIMLPNHAPYMVAEAFGTLAALYGDRIDLGLGRAPGTDMQTARALRRGMASGAADTFPQDVIELIGFLGPLDPQAQLGLPYAFASHFAPQALDQALEVYRRAFRPSTYLEKPHAMIAVNVFGADTDAEGIRLRTTMQQAFARLRLGQPGKLPRPVDNIADHLPPAVLAGVNEALTVSATGSPETVKRELSEILTRHDPDEVIITGQIHDHDARLRSFEIAAEALKAL